LAAEFDSPALFYSPTYNRGRQLRNAVGFFAGIPILSVRSERVVYSLRRRRGAADVGAATAEVMSATADMLQNGQFMTPVIHRRLNKWLGFGDSSALVPRNYPYIVVGYSDHVRAQREWRSGGVRLVMARAGIETVRRGVRRLSTAARRPAGLISIVLSREGENDWLFRLDYEEKRFSEDVIAFLASSVEWYLRRLLMG
jgi:hypothetical protein